MIDLIVSIKRTGLLYDTMETRIDHYQKELTEYEEFIRLHGWDFERLFGSKDLIEKIKALLATEIRYCEFWKKYQVEQQESNFKRWVFKSKETIIAEFVKAGDRWKAEQQHCDRWIKYDGKTKASIEIDRTGAMVKLRLYVENAYNGIDFIPRDPSGEELDVAHLKNEDVIAARIEEMKIKAEAYQKAHQLPAYLQEDQNLTALKRLLCMEA